MTSAAGLGGHTVFGTLIATCGGLAPQIRAEAPALAVTQLPQLVVARYLGNSSEEVQNQATYVTDSNEDEGFAKAIEGFILPRAVAAPAAAGRA